jgi:hypothetical protein
MGKEKNKNKEKEKKDFEDDNNIKKNNLEKSDNEERDKNESEINDKKRSKSVIGLNKNPIDLKNFKSLLILEENNNERITGNLKKLKTSGIKWLSATNTRWFILDFIKKTFSYKNSKNDSKIKKIYNLSQFEEYLPELDSNDKMKNKFKFGFIVKFKINIVITIFTDNEENYNIWKDGFTRVTNIYKKYSIIKSKVFETAINVFAIPYFEEIERIEKERRNRKNLLLNEDINRKDNLLKKEEEEEKDDCELEENEQKKRKKQQEELEEEEEEEEEEVENEDEDEDEEEEKEEGEEEEEKEKEKEEEDFIIIKKENKIDNIKLSEKLEVKPIPELRKSNIISKSIENFYEKEIDNFCFDKRKSIIDSVFNGININYFIIKIFKINHIFK